MDWSSITYSDEIVGKRKRLFEKKRKHDKEDAQGESERPRVSKV